MFWKIVTCLFILLTNPILSAEQNKDAEENSAQIQEEDQSEEYKALHHYENLFVGTFIIAMVATSAVVGFTRWMHKVTCTAPNDGVDIDGLPFTPVRSDTPNGERH